MVPKICSIDGCFEPYRARGYCRTHHYQWLRSTPASERPLPSAEERFWAKVDRGAPEQCWTWQAGIGACGYGLFNANGKPDRAHRFSLSLRLGRPLRPGSVACHTCDNRVCVNPDHLYEGTHQTNVDDAVSRGRTSRGESHPISKLSEMDVLAIRHLAASGEKNRDLAARFGVAEASISNITYGRSWTHIGGPRSFKKKHTKRKKVA